MSRTNIEIDDDLIAQVMHRYGLRTKREAVDFALRRLAVEPMTREEALAMEGHGWHGDLAAMHDEIVEFTVAEGRLPAAAGDEPDPGSPGRAGPGR